MDRYEQNEGQTLNTIMSAKLDLIATYLRQGMRKYAKIETKALKAYLDCQLSFAKNEAKNHQQKSWIEEIES